MTGRLLRRGGTPTLTVLAESRDSLDDVLVEHTHQVTRLVVADVHVGPQVGEFAPKRLVTRPYLTSKVAAKRVVAGARLTSQVGEFAPKRLITGPHLPADGRKLDTHPLTQSRDVRGQRSHGGVEPRLPGFHASLHDVDSPP